MLLVVKINHELNFNEHTTLLYTMAIQKLDAVLRIAYCMSFDQRRLV